MLALSRGQRKKRYRRRAEEGRQQGNMLRLSSPVAPGSAEALRVTLSRGQRKKVILVRANARSRSRDRNIHHQTREGITDRVEGARVGRQLDVVAVLQLPVVKGCAVCACRVVADGRRGQGLLRVKCGCSGCKKNALVLASPLQTWAAESK